MPAIQPFGPGNTYLSDSDRIALAKQVGSKMHGPLERCHCAHHNKRWVTYRWLPTAPELCGLPADSGKDTDDAR